MFHRTCRSRAPYRSGLPRRSSDRAGPVRLVPGHRAGAGKLDRSRCVSRAARDTLLRLLNEHRTFVQPRFDDIRTRGCTPSLDSCVELADAFLQKLPGGTPGPKSRRRQRRPRPHRSACAPSRHDRVRPPASMRCRDTGACRAGRRRARASSAGCRQAPRKPAKRTAPSPAKPRLPGASAHVKSRRTHLKMQCSNSQKCKNE